MSMELNTFFTPSNVSYYFTFIDNKLRLGVQMRLREKRLRTASEPSAFSTWKEQKKSRIPSKRVIKSKCLMEVPSKWMFCYFSCVTFKSVQRWEKKQWQWWRWWGPRKEKTTNQTGRGYCSGKAPRQMVRCGWTGCSQRSFERGCYFANKIPPFIQWQKGALERHSTVWGTL